MNTRLHDTAVIPPPDFKVRAPRPSLPFIIGIFIAGLILAVGVTAALDSKLLVSILLLIVFACIGWYSLSQIQLLQDLLLDAEFQNALFSTSLGMNQKFIAIVRKDNTITYFNRGFQDTFPQFLKQSRRGLDLLLEQCEVKMEDRSKMLGAIASGAQDKIVFDMYGDIGPHKIIMTIEGIMKPSGFSLLRGRDFVEIRKTQVQVTPVLE